MFEISKKHVLECIKHPGVGVPTATDIGAIHPFKNSSNIEISYCNITKLLLQHHEIAAATSQNRNSNMGREHLLNRVFLGLPPSWTMLGAPPLRQPNPPRWRTTAHHGSRDASIKALASLEQEISQPTTGGAVGAPLWELVSMRRCSSFC